MTLELAHQLALNKLVDLLQSLTDPGEIRRVATAILRIKPPKQPVPPDVDRRETAGAEPPQAPSAAHAAQYDQPPKVPPALPPPLSTRFPLSALHEMPKRISLTQRTPTSAFLARVGIAQGTPPPQPHLPVPVSWCR